MPNPLNPHYDDPAVIYDSGFFYADDVPVSTPNPTPKRMAKLKLNTSRMTPAQLIALADVVLPKIAPTAPATPPVPNMASKATSLETKRDAAHAANEAYEAAKAGLPAMKVARDAAADELREEHIFVGSALEAESRGDAGMLSATGYPLAGESVPTTTPPEMIDNLKLTSGDLDGALDGSFDSDPLARIYEVQLTSVDPVAGPWTKVLNSTVSSFQLTSLTSGQRVWVRVRGVGTQGEGPWSDPATKIVP